MRLALLRALVTGSAQRLAPTIEELGCLAILPSWQQRVVDSNHILPAKKLLGVWRRERGAAQLDFSVVVDDLDLDQVVDLQPFENVYVSVLPLLERPVRGNCGWLIDFTAGSRSWRSAKKINQTW